MQFPRKKLNLIDQHYLDLGVDGLITDYPDRLLRILNRQPAEETSWATP